MVQVSEKRGNDGNGMKRGLTAPHDAHARAMSMKMNACLMRLLTKHEIQRWRELLEHGDSLEVLK